MDFLCPAFLGMQGCHYETAVCAINRKAYPRLCIRLHLPVSQNCPFLFRSPLLIVYFQGAPCCPGVSERCSSALGCRDGGAHLWRERGPATVGAARPWHGGGSCEGRSRGRGRQRHVGHEAKSFLFLSLPRISLPLVEVLY